MVDVARRTTHLTHGCQRRHRRYVLSNIRCCRCSRSSLLTGRFTHNGGARNNSVQGDCCSDKWYTEREPDALAAHMNASGYFSLYAGYVLQS